MDWLDSIWKPDPFFNGAKKMVSHTVVANKYLWLYADGSFFYSIKYVLLPTAVAVDVDVAVAVAVAVDVAVAVALCKARAPQFPPKKNHLFKVKITLLKTGFFHFYLRP